MNTISRPRSREAEWLEYCRHVVRDQQHRELCWQGGGSNAGDPDGRGRVVYVNERWPGYLGPAYEPGGLLWVNIVHEDLGQSELRPQADGYAAATARWRGAEPIDRAEDDRYLAAQRAMYDVGLRQWNVARLIRDVAVNTLGQSVEKIAYANAARCQVLVRSDRKHGQVQNALVRRCETWLSLSAVVGALSPSLVIMSSAALLEYAPCFWPGVITVGLSQRYRVLDASPWKPRTVDWRRDLSSDWQAHRRTSSG